MEFSKFGERVQRSFQEIASGGEVFVVDVDGDAMYERYLAAFPEGTNPVYRKKTEHDCSCCKHFIRRVGAVTDGTRTVWDEAAKSAPYPFNVVATAMRDMVNSEPIKDIYRVGQKEATFGAAQTRAMDCGTVVNWNHFYTGSIPTRLRVDSPDGARGAYRTAAQVFQRGLEELSSDAVLQVLDLIRSNALYRGEEHKRAVEGFLGMQSNYLAAADKKLFVWQNAANPASRFRNTVIGTLVQDLSEGKDLESAVKSFETKVAPTNYKRTTALITPGMVKKAMATIEELGLEPALERRFAVISDISVNDVKWVDGSVKPLMKGGIGEVLSKVAQVTEARVEGATDISLEKFMADILPETTGLEILFKGGMKGNLMSLTAPCHPEPKQLFRWNNDFAWSYAGNITDSIKERVKRAGGKVEGVALRVSLSWFNFDDLDLHIREPHGGEIYFHNKLGHTGGRLDVDMNAGGRHTREAVENVVWTRVPDGAYEVIVNNWNQRETSDPGFVIEVENAGEILQFSYDKTVRNGSNVSVARLHVKGGILERVEVCPGIKSGSISQEKWGLQTEKFVKVSAVTLSPNYWGDNAVGNKHTFFVLEGAKNDEPTRGIYNEFLHPRLEPHRKVFEVIGDKTKCQPTDGQLSGLGFSSTQKTSFTVRAQQGKKSRVFNVHVG